jgi:hypothetical protein
MQQIEWRMTLALAREAEAEVLHVFLGVHNVGLGA